MRRAMRELIATPEHAAEPEGWRDKLMQVASQNPEIVERVSSTLERIVARILPGPRTGPTSTTAQTTQNRANTRSSQPPVVPGPFQRPAHTEAPSSEAASPNKEESTVTLDSFVLGIKEDIQEGNEPNEAIADAATLFSEQSELGPVIVGLLEKTNEELLAILRQATGASLDRLNNANEYLDGLREGVRKRLRIPQNESSHNSENQDRAAP